MLQKIWQLNFETYSHRVAKFSRQHICQISFLCVKLASNKVSRLCDTYYHADVLLFCLPDSITQSYFALNSHVWSITDKVCIHPCNYIFTLLPWNLLKMSMNIISARNEIWNCLVEALIWPIRNPWNNFYICQLCGTSWSIWT